MREIIILVFSCLILLSCNKKDDKDYKRFRVTDFSKKRMDTLIPYKDKNYTLSIIKVKGNTNDTIKIINNKNTIRLSGEIDTVIRNDYYGGDIRVFIFDPYKATKGSLEIEYSL